MNVLHYDSVIESADKYNGKQVGDLIDKGVIFQMIKSIGDINILIMKYKRYYIIW